MYSKMKDYLQSELKSIEEGGIFKRERIITTPQGAKVKVQSGEEVVIMCGFEWFVRCERDIYKGAIYSKNIRQRWVRLLKG